MADLQLTLASQLSKIAPNYFASQLRNPFFIIGSARSGTTILVQTFASHEEIATYPSEANTLWHPQTYPWRRSPLRDQIPPLWVDPERFTRFSIQYRTHDQTQRLRSAFGAYQLLSRKKYFLNKSAMITFMIRFIRRTFPDAHFIHMVRDGHAVALSYAKKEFKKIHQDPNVYQEQGLNLSFEELLKECARSWRQHIEEVERQKEELSRQNALYEVRYERFCQDPRRELSQLAKFMGVDPAGFRWTDYSHIRSRNFKYREELEPDTLRALSHIMQPQLANQGYAREQSI